MFLGHFALGIAAKKAQPKISLAILLTAAQLPDLLWPAFLIAGIEHVELAASGPIPLVFSDYPISHGLFFVLAWGLIFGVIYFLLEKRLRAAMVIGLLVVSHWFLDVLVHFPDLPVLPGYDFRAGLGLWNYRWIVAGIEMLMLAVAIRVYLHVRRSGGLPVSGWFWSLIVLLLVVQAGDLLGPPPRDIRAIGWLGSLQWLFIFSAWLAERKISPVAATAGSHP